MTEVSAETAVVVASSAGVLGVLWAAFAGLQSARRGPEWLLGHLPRAVRTAVGLAVAGVAGALVLRPFWLGLALAYVAGVVALVGRAMHRGLSRAAELGALTLPPADRRAAMLSRVALTLFAVAAAFALVGLADLVWWRGWPALFDFLLVAALAALGTGYLREARALV